jgi:predicted amidohydrolase
MLLHNSCSISSIESARNAKFPQFIGVLHISYNRANNGRKARLYHWIVFFKSKCKGNPLKIAVHQMCSTIDTEKNAAAMVHAVYQASQDGAVMYFAPEMSILVDRDRNRARASICAESDMLSLGHLSRAAAEGAIWVHVGSVPVLDAEGGKFANRSIILGPDGSVHARYDKMHLFDVELSTGENWRESAAYVGGPAPAIVNTPLGRMGLSICYDLRFPDLYSAYSKADVDILAVPSAFTVPTGEAHWHVLLRARAIESQSFVVAAAQCGNHQDGRTTYGHSLVIDPWGDVLLDMGQGEGLGFADIDLARIDGVRRQIPVHKNRREMTMPVKRF